MCYWLATVVAGGQAGDRDNDVDRNAASSSHKPSDSAAPSPRGHGARYHTRPPKCPRLEFVRETGGLGLVPVAITIEDLPVSGDSPTTSVAGSSKASTTDEVDPGLLYDHAERCPEGTRSHGTFCARSPSGRDEYFITCRRLQPLKLAPGHMGVDYRLPAERIWGRCPQPYRCERYNHPAGTERQIRSQARGTWSAYSGLPAPAIRCIKKIKNRRTYAWIDYRPAPREVPVRETGIEPSAVVSVALQAATPAVTEEIPLLDTITQVDLMPLPDSFSGVLWDWTCP